MSRSLSVIVPVLDGATTLRETLEAITENADGLSELIVVDDGSTDGSGEIAEDHGARVLRNETPQGLGAARERGLNASTGELVGFMDDDDIWLQAAPDPRRALLEADPGVDVVVGRYQMFGMRTGKAADFEAPRRSVIMQGALFRRDVFERFGSPDTGDHLAEDLAWMTKARRLGARIELVDEVVVRYRVHAGGLSRDRTAMESKMFSILRREIAESRKQRD
jgi:glycosyltransferase involved in cell wall biosynthesis